MVMINSAKGSLQKKKLGHLKVNFFYVYFAFQTILSILIFLLKFTILGGQKSWDRGPPRLA